VVKQVGHPRVDADVRQEPVGTADVFVT